MVRGVSGQGVGGPTFRVGVECGVCVERCPFDVEISSPRCARRRRGLRNKLHKQDLVCACTPSRQTPKWLSRCSALVSLSSAGPQFLIVSICYFHYSMLEWGNRHGSIPEMIQKRKNAVCKRLTRIFDHGPVAGPAGNRLCQARRPDDGCAERISNTAPWASPPSAGQKTALCSKPRAWRSGRQSPATAIRVVWRPCWTAGR